jgi:hypothetical protein
MSKSSGQDQRLRSGTGPLTSLSNVWQPRTAIIVAMAKANDMSTIEFLRVRREGHPDDEDHIGRSSRLGSPEALQNRKRAAPQFAAID